MLVPSEKVTEIAEGRVGLLVIGKENVCVPDMLDLIDQKRRV